MKYKKQRIHTFTESELRKHDRELCHKYGFHLIKDVLVSLQDDFDYDKDRLIDFLECLRRVTVAQNEGLIDDRKVEALLKEYSDFEFIEG